MKKYATNRDVIVSEFAGFPYGPQTVPRGTALVPVQGGLGVSYAVQDVSLVAALFNAWDAEHRWLFVPDDAVQEVE